MLTITVADRDEVRFPPGGPPVLAPAGRVLLCCQSRCSDVRDILDGLGLGLGLWFEDLRPGPRGVAADPARPGGVRITDLRPLADPAELDPGRLAYLEGEHGRCRAALAACPGKLAELAAALGVSGAALEDLGVGLRPRNAARDEGGGWADAGPAWTFPMVDGRGRVVNLQRRFEDPGEPERGLAGGRIGLFVPRGWLDRPGPVCCVEVASDAAALHDLGLAAVGRPSNLAGDAHLAELLRDDAREVVVLGENDRKADGAWPGDPRPFAAKLARRLCRPVKVMLPPAGSKDAREWRRGVDAAAMVSELLRRAAVAEEVAPCDPAPPAPGRPLPATTRA